MNGRSKFVAYSNEERAWNKHGLVSDLILIEGSDSDGDNKLDTTKYQTQNHNQTEEELNQETKRLQAASREKFVNAWKKIFEKYEQIDDDKESDEIDIITGKIYKDNGHLRSLKQEGNHGSVLKLESDIWADVDEDEIQYNVKLSRIRRRRPKQNRPDQKPTALLEDNLLLGPSPTKKKKITPNNCHAISPSKNSINQDDLHNISPTKGQVPSGPNYTESPTKENLFNENKPPTDIFLKKLSFGNLPRNQGFSKLNLEDLSILSSSTQKSDVDYDSNTSEHSISTQTDAISDFDDGTNVSTGKSTSSTCTQLRKFTFYLCYFNCDYCTGNKLLFENHLLDKHSPELKTLGYPVKVVKQIPVINKAEVLKKITTHFPLSYAIPPPSTIENQHLILNKTNANVSLSNLVNNSKKETNHELNGVVNYEPSLLVCPMLGCGFTTNRGYSEWRNHFIEEKHNIDPNFNSNLGNNRDSKSQFNSYNFEDSIKVRDIMKPNQYSSDINELWDNSSDLEFDSS